MNLSKPLRVILAKSGDGNCGYLPLWVHSTDAAMVMERLFYDRFSLSGICDIDEELLKKTAILLAYLHDVGKITPLFQAKILGSLPEYRGVLEQNGMNVSYLSDYLEPNRSHHSICGESLLLKLGFPKELSSVVGIHHGSYRCDGSAEDHIDSYIETYFSKKRDRELWMRLYKEWAAYSLEKAGFSSVEEIPRLDKKTMVLLSGLLVMCDWIASDQTKFPLFDENRFFTEDDYPADRCENALSELALPDGWQPQYLNITDDDFDRCFGFPMNSVQSAMIDASANSDTPGIFILEAPMGVGKTEAALSAAEILANKCGKTGLFFGLPTQATANGIFGRVKRWAEDRLDGLTGGINLAHGSAEFHSEFAKMSKRVPSVDNDEDSDGGLVVHSFFCGNKPSLLADFVVGTVDRLLMSALKKKHAMLLHLGLSQKVVIVDECHAYDAYMNKYLDRALTWLHEYNVPVILLSATLPPDRRLALINAYLHGKNKKTELKENDLPAAKYPRLTYTDGEQINGVSIPVKTISKEVVIVRSDDDRVIKEIRAAIAAGACVGIICNTVKRAQEFAKAARETDGANVILYHAQFTIPDRVKREEDLIKAVGKLSTPAERTGTVVVGTQVLEQSLDIDFDLLITDLCPMDLLLQRIGRLHRHPRADRPKGYKNARCVVLGTEKFAEASKKIYTEWLLLQTRKNLPEMITLPDDIDHLVCETYKLIEPSEEDAAAYEKYNFMLKEKEAKAEAFLMSVPRDSRYGNDLHNWISGSISDSDAKAQAAVRDGVSSIEVILMISCNDGRLKCFNSDERYSPKECPPEEKCCYITQQRLRLPSRFCQDYNADKTIAELEKKGSHLTGFQHSHWLRGELFLLLDENLSAHLGGCKIGYSNENGLEYEKEE